MSVFEERGVFWWHDEAIAEGLLAPDAHVAGDRLHFRLAHRRELHVGVAFLAAIVDAVVALEALGAVEQPVEHPGVGVIVDAALAAYDGSPAAFPEYDRAMEAASFYHINNLKAKKTNMK